jgi:hypothetical protein
MPITSADIEYRLSGGASNDDPDAALGGAMSSEVVPTAQFDNVSASQAESGSVEYRCFYVLNTHDTLTLENAAIWIQANTSGSDTAIALGAGTAAIDGTEQTIANEATAPTGVTFSAAADEGAAISLGNLGPGSSKSVWIRRTVNEGASAGTDTYTLRVKGDTLP